MKEFSGAKDYVFLMKEYITVTWAILYGYQFGNLKFHKSKLAPRLRRMFGQN